MRRQNHLLEQAATYSIDTAEEYGRRKLTGKQRTLLQSALILAETAGARELIKRCKKLLEQVPPFDVVVSELWTKLDEVVEKLGELYSQEACESGQVRETNADTIEAAIVECLGAENTVIVKPPVSSFKTLRRTVAHKQLVQLIGALTPEFAHAGDPDCFSPDDQATPGGFSYCFFFKAAAGSGEKNLLVNFPTAMT